MNSKNTLRVRKEKNSKRNVSNGERSAEKNPIKHEEKIQIIPTKFMYEIFDSLCSVFQLCGRAWTLEQYSTLPLNSIILRPRISDFGVFLANRFWILEITFFTMWKSSERVNGRGMFRVERGKKWIGAIEYTKNFDIGIHFLLHFRWKSDAVGKNQLKCVKMKAKDDISSGWKAPFIKIQTWKKQISCSISTISASIYRLNFKLSFHHIELVIPTTKSIFYL